MTIKEEGALLKTARLSKGLTQIELGAQMGLWGGQYVSNIERGLVPFPISHLKDFKRIFGNKAADELVKSKCAQFKKLLLEKMR